MRKSGLPQGTLVLVADGEKALFLVNEGDAEDMNLVLDSQRSQDNPPTREWGTDTPGRYNDGPTVQRSAVSETDWHVLEKERFADDLAEKLYERAHSGRFDRLVIVASRLVLSHLRKSLHDEVRKRILLEVPKVLTNHTVDDIETLLSRELKDA